MLALPGPVFAVVMTPLLPVPVALTLFRFTTKSPEVPTRTPIELAPGRDRPERSRPDTLKNVLTSTALSAGCYEVVHSPAG